MALKHLLAGALITICPPLLAQSAQPFDASAAFGARESVSDLRLAPNGASVSYLAPTQGQGSALHTLSLLPGAKDKVALSSDGNPDRLVGCNWVSDLRLVCEVSAVLKDPTYRFLPFTRLIAVNADGSNMQLLSKRENAHSRGLALGGGSVIDWLPDEDGAVLMTRQYLADEHLGSHLGSSNHGLGVDWLDTASLKTKQIEAPRAEAVEYISDYRGTVRIVGIDVRRSRGMESGIIQYMYRPKGSREWRQLGDFSYADEVGFNPLAVDPELNVAYGLKKNDGRWALYSVTLDETPRERLIYGRPDVDVGDLIRIGRRQRVVGVSYITDASHAEIFAPEIAGLLGSLSKVLPQQPLLRIADSSNDESKLLVFAGSDSDPGVYYIFDRKSHQLQTFLVARSPLEGVKLASVKPMSYPAGDGVSIPAYLTLPPGITDPKGLPAIVLPHGGPEDRDTWGFDWLPQFFAARGYVVLQPNFRGSSGYGSDWLQHNGFKSWEVAVGDVLAAGHWLVSQGIADPGKLAIIGWSYGGYAALQSAVTDPSVYKAVIGIAPVTDLAALKEESRHWTDYELVDKYLGNGPHIHDGSPIEHADKMKVPVLLFHAGFDRNVSIEQSRRMAARLKAAGASCELVTWENLDHQLEDSAARAQMLSKSDAFLRQAFGK